MDNKFDNIRPYNDAEASKAMKIIADSQYIEPIAGFLFPEIPNGADVLRDQLRHITGVEDFQVSIMSNAINSIVKKTTGGLSCSGLGNLKKADGTNGRFLFLSTHRDIVLDPAFLQILFHSHKFPMTEIAVGDNLMVNPVVEGMIRSNRMIKVVRSESPREVYMTSKILSEYIRIQVSGETSSIWLAHRQGRTKNGMDATEQGLLKMLDMSGSGDFVNDFEALHILPISISYEYEPCGTLKAMELWTREKTGTYKKQKGEDLNSMLKGITQYKGRVHVEFCKPVTADELAEADSYEKNDKFRRLAEIIDSRLLPAFKLWPSNYIALDILNGNKSHLGIDYNESQVSDFHKYSGLDELPNEEVKVILLKIYAAHLL